MIAKLGRAVLCAPIAIKNMRARSDATYQDASHTKQTAILSGDEARQNRSELFYRRLWPKLPVGYQSGI